MITSTEALLEEIGIPYILFKTLKPFPNTPSEIDILLWSYEALKNTTSALKKAWVHIIGEKYIWFDYVQFKTPNEHRLNNSSRSFKLNIYG